MVSRERENQRKITCIDLFTSRKSIFLLSTDSMRLTKRTPRRSPRYIMLCWEVKESRDCLSKKSSVLHVVTWLTHFTLKVSWKVSMFLSFFVFRWKSCEKSGAWIEKVNKTNQCSQFLLYLVSVYLYLNVAREKSLASNHVANTWTRSTRSLPKGLQGIIFCFSFNVQILLSFAHLDANNSVVSQTIVDLKTNGGRFVSFQCEIVA